ncbi:g1599 [Coccomyxa viridis]|uniref:G1599 protein n=1 Tax=Coccomyxa viridis TaxID=1274662 RepID=A0ABP1FM53_9CHLO
MKRKRPVEKLTVDELLDGAFLDEGTALPGKGGPKATAQPTSSAGETGNGKPKVKRKRKDEGAEFQDELATLQQRDPEFFAYLKETDNDLLNFSLPPTSKDTDEDAADDSADEDDKALGNEGKFDDKDQDLDASKEVSARGQERISAEVLSQWCLEAKQHASLRAMRKLMKAFRVACHYGDTETEMDSTLRSTSTVVFNRLVIFVLKEADQIFRQLLGVSTDAELASGAVKRQPRWNKVEPLLKSYLGNSLHLLGNATSPGMQMFTLRRLRPAVAWLASFQRLQRKYMRHSLAIFSTSCMALRVQALLFIRHMATLIPDPALDQALKGVYRAFVRNAKFMTQSSAPDIAFVGSCVVEMYGLDLVRSYEHAFTYIKQLASLLRGAMSSHSKDAYRQVYCWQTVNTLELWSKLLAAHHDKEELRPLAYPLCQIMVGAIKLKPTARYYTLHLRLMRSLIHLGGATRLLMPVVPMLLDMLKWTALSKRVSAGAGAPQQGAFLLRASKAVLTTPAFQADIIQQTLELLAAHFAQWACSTAFPEMMHLPLQQLRRFAKQCKVERFRSSAKALAAALEANIAYVAAQRASDAFAPKDTASVLSFLASDDASQKAPLQVYARMLAEKAQQQRALQRADAVEADREEDASSEDEEVVGIAAAAQPSADTGEALAASALPLAKPSRAAPPKKPTPQLADDGLEDELQDYELPEDEED